MATPDQIITTRAFLRGGLTTVQRVDAQLVDAMLAHAGSSYAEAEDHLNAALVIAQQLLTLLGQARQALDCERPAQLEAA